MTENQTLARFAAIAGCFVGLLTVLVAVVQVLWGWERGEFIHSLIFFGMVGYLSGVGALFLFMRRPPDPLKHAATLGVITALAISWVGGPSEAFIRAGWARYYIGDDMAGPGLFFLGFFVYSFLIGGRVWFD